MKNQDFLIVFLDEATETLLHWEQILMTFEKEGQSQENLNTLFRCAHNLKGSSASVDLKEMAKFIHRAEDVITRLRDGKIVLSPSIFSALFSVQSTLMSWVEKLRADSDAQEDVADLSAKLQDFLSNSNSLETQQSPENGEIIFDTEVLERFKAEQSDIRCQNSKELKIDDVKIKVDVQGEALKSTTLTPKLSPDETIRVSLRRLDAIIRYVGELSVHHSIVHLALENGTLETEFARNSINLTSKVIADLQSEAMTLRMQPLEGVFQRMERVVRDVSIAQSKDVRVVVRGSDVELDKTVIDKIKDALVHLLRNAVDHGIESAEVRERLNKSAAATITIEATSTAASVTIRISDDGAGLNEEKILKKAIETGVVSPDVELTRGQIHQLIFSPGFSTADKITDISGRGVGLDVVNRAVRELNGKIEIRTELNAGTSFEISLPSSLSILEAVIVSVADNILAVPLQDIEEVLDLQKIEILSTSQFGRTIDLHGQALAVESLGKHLRMGEPAADLKEGMALVTRMTGGAMAFHVDDILGQQSIVVRKLEGKLENIPGISGGTILASGEPGMIVSLAPLAKLFFERN